MARLPEQRYDVTIYNHGTVALIAPLTDTAREWITANLQVEEWQWFGGKVACEPRMIADVVDGMESDGLEVSRA